jgi:hypothetical protein
MMMVFYQILNPLATEIALRKIGGRHFISVEKQQQLPQQWLAADWQP